MTLCINNWKGNLIKARHYPFSLNTENPFVVPELTDSTYSRFTFGYIISELSIKSTCAEKNKIR